MIINVVELNTATLDLFLERIPNDEEDEINAPIS